MKEPANILVVDDNKDLLFTFSLILKRKGFIVETAEDGLLAVEKYKKNHFDIVLMDAIMPNMNGVDALHKIREMDTQAKVILITAYCEDEQMKRAVKEGAYRALYKPVDIGKLLDLINDVTGDPSILIVDDDDDFRNTMCSMLDIQGFKVCAASNGVEAINMVRQKKFNIAFVDIKMSVMDGLTTSIKLKEVNPEILIVMMTGYRDEVKEIVEQASVRGINKCLYKPFKVDELKTLVCQSG